MAVALLLVGAFPAQNAIASPLSAVITATNTGTLLSAKAAPLDSLSLVTHLEPGGSLSIGAVTLSSSDELSMAGPDTLLRTSNISASIPPALDNNLRVASATNGLPYDSGNSEAPFVAWSDESGAFEEMVAAPEPSTWAAAFLSFFILAWHRRQRFLARAIFPSRLTSRRGDFSK